MPPKVVLCGSVLAVKRFCQANTAARSPNLGTTLFIKSGGCFGWTAGASFSGALCKDVQKMSTPCAKATCLLFNSLCYRLPRVLSIHRLIL